MTDNKTDTKYTSRELKYTLPFYTEREGIAMAEENGITIYDGYVAMHINEDGHLIYEHDAMIDNVDFSLNTDGHLIEEDG